MIYLKRDLLTGNFRVTYDRIMLVMDSIGLGIFTVVGVNKGIQMGYIESTFLLVFLGTITGVGGGLLRDMMAGVPPYIFVRHVYACASIAGCSYLCDHEPAVRSRGSDDRGFFSSDPLKISGGPLPLESSADGMEGRIKQQPKGIREIPLGCFIYVKQRISFRRYIKWMRKSVTYIIYCHTI